MSIVSVVVSLVLMFALVMFMAVGWVREVVKNSQLKLKHQQDLKEQRADAVKRSRSVIEGKVFEQLVPYLPNWIYAPSDARFLGTPVDFVIFNGMSTGEPDKIVFVEVKKGSSSTTVLQNKIKALVVSGKIVWEVIKVA